MQYIKIEQKYENMKILLKLNFKYHLPNNDDTIPQELIVDNMHTCAFRTKWAFTYKKRYFKY
jgi:hypothetical protein